MVYGVVQQVYSVVTPNSVILHTSDELLEEMDNEQSF